MTNNSCNAGAGAQRTVSTSDPSAAIRQSPAPQRIYRPFNVVRRVQVPSTNRLRAVINPNPQCSNQAIIQRGFTLLEIMVVVLLIGVSVTVIVVNLERDIDQVAEQEARRFATLVEHLRDESILTGRLHGIEIDEPERRYQFLRFDKEWMPVEQDDSFRPRVIPDYLDVQLNAGQEQDGNTLVVVDALGEIQPFFVTIIGRDFEYVVNLNSRQNVEVERKAREAG